jgi:hypothetical protein
MPVSPSQNYTDSVQGSLYEQGMEISNDFDFDPGVCILPLAEDPPESEGELATWSPVVVLRLHAPYRQRKTRYNTAKTNNPPIMPTPEKDSGAFIFVGGTLSIQNVMNQSYISFDWLVQSEYIYVENCVSRNQDGYVLGMPPWRWETNAINAAGFAPAAPTIGAVSHAGSDVLVAAAMGGNIVPDQDSTGTYFYNMTNYLPGRFFSDNLINGGIPVNPVPPVSQG